MGSQEPKIIDPPGPADRQPATIGGVSVFKSSTPVAPFAVFRSRSAPGVSLAIILRDVIETGSAKARREEREGKKNAACCQAKGDCRSSIVDSEPQLGVLPGG